MAIAREAPFTKRCFLRETPPEIMEMIIGNIPLTDFIAFAEASNWTKNAWLESKYFTQLSLIRQHQPKAVKWLYNEFRRNSDKAVWRIHDVLKAFIDEHCECGNYGWWVQWLSTPPRKLCTACAEKREFCCVMLNKAMKHYQLTRSDVKKVPTLKAASVDFDSVTITKEFPANAVLAQITTLEAIVKRKGREVNPMGLEISTGFVDAPTYDLLGERACRSILCELCPSTESRRRLPWAYEPLRNHVAQHHPGGLEAFEIGWKELGPSRQEKWLKNAEFSQMPSSQFEYWVKHHEVFRPGTWSSWARISHESFYPHGGYSLGAIYGTADQTMQKVRRELQTLIFEHINHSGQLFELPYILDPNKAREQSLCLGISRCSVEAILDIEMNAVLTRWKGLIEEHGLDKVAEAYFAGSKSDGV